MEEVAKKCQKRAFELEFQQLKENVSPADKAAAMKGLGIRSRHTITSYLNGNIRNLDTASQLLFFFKNCIEKRNQVIDK